MKRARAESEAPAFRIDWPTMANVSTQPVKSVTLIDGTVVDNASPEWRAECEARHVLAMPSRRLRHDYLNRVLKRRGQASRDALEAGVMAVWRSRREAG